MQQLQKDRKFQFDMERAVFLTVFYCLLISGSDRACDRWRRDYKIPGTESLSLHQLYRAMAFLGEELVDQKDAVVFVPRRRKDVIEEELFSAQRDLFSGLELVYFSYHLDLL